MKTSWVFLAFFSWYFVAISAHRNRANPELHWQNYKKAYNKLYVTPREEAFRRNTFLRNLKDINEWNERYRKGKVRFAVGVNKLADLTFEERKALKVKTPRFSGKFSKVLDVANTSINLQADDFFDLSKDTPCLSSVRDQTEYNSGHAIAAVTLLEFAKCVENGTYGTFEALSVDQALDCAPNTNGNTGRNYKDIFQYFTQYSVMPETAYNTTDKNVTCKYNATLGIGKLNPDSIQKLSSLDYGNAKPYLAAHAAYKLLKEKGPIAVKFDTGGPTSLFDFYKSGVYSDQNCANFFVNGKLDTDHSLVLIGITQTNKRDYIWIAQNSMGKDWGINGLMYLPFWQNTCNIGLDPYVIDPVGSFVKQGS